MSRQTYRQWTQAHPQARKPVNHSPYRHSSLDTFVSFVIGLLVLAGILFLVHLTFTESLASVLDQIKALQGR